MRKNAIQGLREERDCGGDCQASGIQNIKGGACLLSASLGTPVMDQILGKHSVEAA